MTRHTTALLRIENDRKIKGNKGKNGNENYKTLQSTSRTRGTPTLTHFTSDHHEILNSACHNAIAEQLLYVHRYCKEKNTFCKKYMSQITVKTGQDIIDAKIGKDNGKKTDYGNQGHFNTSPPPCKTGMKKGAVNQPRNK